MKQEKNKMWEGHRIIYPNLRERFLQSKNEPFPRPYWDEQRLEYLESVLAQALNNSLMVKLTLWHVDGPREKEIIPIQQRGRFLEALDQQGQRLYILLADILDIN
jgi:hypothetical protein